MIRSPAVAAALGALLLTQACASEAGYRRPGWHYEAAPPLVEVEPGVQVVPDQDEEVFYSDGSYWTRHGERWWRSPDHRGNWAVAEERAVPNRIQVYPAGRYRRYRGPEHPVVPVR